MRSQSRRRFLQRAGMLGALAALPATGTPTSAATPVRGGALIVTVPAEPPHLCSAFDSNMGPCLIGSKVMEGLVTYDHALRPMPALAKAWAVSSDGLLLTFLLQEDVLWHDGHPFGSDDVAFSLTHAWRVLHPFGRTAYENVVAVETPDPLTVRFKLAAPAPYILSFLNTFGAQILPRHVYEGTDIRTNPANWAPIGTGPFVFKQWVRGSHIRLERNPHYWKAGRPYLDAILYRFIPDPIARTLALLSGEVHMAVSSCIPLANLHLFSNPSRYAINRRDGRYLFSVFMAHFNVRRPYLAAVEVRQAFMHAIDRDLLVRLTYFGYGKAATGPIPSTETAFYANTLDYPFDPAKAGRMLDDAGFKPGADGIRLKLTLDFIDTVNIHIAEFIREQLGKIGVNIVLRVGDIATYLRRIYTDEDYDLALNTTHALPDPNLGVQRLYWSKSIMRGVPWSNGSRYSNPALDAVMESAAHEGNSAKRVALIREWQEIIQRDLPVLNLVELEWITVSDVRVHIPIEHGDGLFAPFDDITLAT